MNNIIKYGSILLLLFIGNVFAETLLCGHEPGEPNVTISIPYDTTASCSVVQGGTAGAPYPTEGDYLLKVNCGHEADEQVEVRYVWDTFTFDLVGNDRILFDVYIPSAMNPLVTYAIWDEVFGAPPTLTPLVYDEWVTIESDVSAITNTGLDHIWAIYFRDWAADDQIMYIDNIRLLSFTPNLKTVTGQEDAIEIYWEPMDRTTIGNLDGWNVYRRPSGGGAWSKIASEIDSFVYVDFVGANGLSYDYKITSVVNGVESSYSNVLSATSIAQTDAEFIETFQRASFRYFWDYAHPVSGLIRGHYPWTPFAITERITFTEASGMGIQVIIAGSENGYITREQAARRTLKMLRFYDSKTPRFHGAWAHWYDGASGEVIPFSQYDDGADIVMTAMLVQAFVCAKEYYTGADAVETEIRTLVDSLWNGVEWDWFRRMPETNGDIMYFHWSPNYGWEINMPYEGWLETPVLYILAIAADENSIPVSCYHDGWIGPNQSWFYYNGLEYYGHRLWAAYYGALFTQQMAFICLDPRYRDNVCNYFDNAKNWTLYHREYCIDNPLGHTDYGANEWGLSADYDPWGYIGHEPGASSPFAAPDNGTISTTAILGSMPFTPTESTAAIRHIYDKYEDDMYGAFGFKDSYNRNENWFGGTFASINMGTNIPMIENYRSGMFWDLFMANADIQQAFDDIGFATNPNAGLNVEYYEGSWSSVPDFDSLTPVSVEVASVPMAYIRNREDNYGLRFSGFIDIEEFGSYTFYTNSEDGSKLYINDQLVVNNDGLRSSPVEKSGAKTLAPGKAKITVEFIAETGDQFLEVSYQGPGMTKRVIPVTALFRCNMTGDPNNDCNANLYDVATLGDDWLGEYDFDDLVNLALDWLD